MVGHGSYLAQVCTLTRSRHWPCRTTSSTDCSPRCGRMWSRSAQRSSATAAIFTFQIAEVPPIAADVRGNTPTDRRPADEASVNPHQRLATGLLSGIHRWRQAQPLPCRLLKATTRARSRARSAAAPPGAELRPGVRHRSACTGRAALSTLPRAIAIETLSTSCHLVHDR